MTPVLTLFVTEDGNFTWKFTEESRAVSPSLMAAAALSLTGMVQNVLTQQTRSPVQEAEPGFINRLPRMNGN